MNRTREKLKRPVPLDADRIAIDVDATDLTPASVAAAARR